MIAQPRLAIVVPGAAVWEGGLASDALRRRVQCAARLYHECQADCLILTGGEGRHPPAEAVVAMGIAHQHGVPEDAIYCEDQSTNSFENMVLAREELGAERAAAMTFLVVSDWYHLPRLWLILAIMGQPCRVRAVPRAAYQDTFTFLQWRSSLNELIKLPYYALTLPWRWCLWQKLRQKG